MTTATILTVARAEALFTSRLATGSQPTYDTVEEAIRIAVRAHRGVRGCAADVAGEYGDHPESAAPRMRWARRLVEELYDARRGRARRRLAWALVA
ncbi:hypothetical protein [Actinoplanes solisilvae]|uniref:hypothetical protein n=1 Tax=Actinoplanes solisilvae TaxID=2486853 RepID=UPI00196AB6F4|nr:hypothetical protein [Actinoplanes solisilvae]